MRFQSGLIAVVVLTASVVVPDDNLDESKAIGKIELLGGKVEGDESLPGRPVIGVDLHRSKRFSDKYLLLLNVFKNLESQELVGIKITDVGLKPLGEDSLKVPQCQKTV